MKPDIPTLHKPDILILPRHKSNEGRQISRGHARMVNLIMGVFAGGVGNQYTRALVKRLGGEHSRRFHGITVGGTKILYRHGQYRYTVSPSNHKTYYRWFWIGATDADLRLVDFVLFHATKPEETFFLVPTKKAKAIIDGSPPRISVAVEPGRAGTRDQLEPFKVSFSELKKKLST
ncbi:MAG TPA: hypothetical protein VGO67_17830 [Verrucomicrobiae bacterium]|jgi:hypothetical protein